MFLLIAIRILVSDYLLFHIGINCQLAQIKKTKIFAVMRFIGLVMSH
jgi:hypothetical protein